MTREEWRPVVGYEGSYSVNRAGDVRSEARTVPQGRRTYTVREYVLQPYKRGGYPSVTLARNGLRQCRSVCQLVREAFGGEL